MTGSSSSPSVSGNLPIQWRAAPCGHGNATCLKSGREAGRGATVDSIVADEKSEYSYKAQVGTGD